MFVIRNNNLDVYDNQVNLNPFPANVPYLYPLKTSENQRVSDIFRGCRKGTLAWNGLSLLINLSINPFHTNVLFLYPLKTSKNQTVSDFFRGYRNRKLARKGLMEQRMLAWNMVCDSLCYFFSWFSFFSFCLSNVVNQFFQQFLKKITLNYSLMLILICFQIKGNALVLFLCNPRRSGGS